MIKIIFLSVFQLEWLSAMQLIEYTRILKLPIDDLRIVESSVLSAIISTPKLHFQE